MLGPNGSGKTTLLRALAGLQPLSGGRIVLDGVVLDDPVRQGPGPSRTSIVRDGVPGLLALPSPDARWPTSPSGPGAGAPPRPTPPDRPSSGSTGWAWRDKAQSRPGQLSGGAGPAGGAGPGPGHRSAAPAARRADGRPRRRYPWLDAPPAPPASPSVSGGSCVMVTHDPLDAAAIADRLVIIEAGGWCSRGRFGGGDRPSAHRLRRRADGAQPASGAVPAAPAWCLTTGPPSRPPSPAKRGHAGGHRTHGTSPSTWSRRAGARATPGPPGWPRCICMGDRARVRPRRLRSR